MVESVRSLVSLSGAALLCMICSRHAAAERERERTKERKRERRERELNIEISISSSEQLNAD